MFGFLASDLFVDLALFYVIKALLCIKHRMLRHFESLDDVCALAEVFMKVGNVAFTLPFGITKFMFIRAVASIVPERNLSNQVLVVDLMPYNILNVRILFDFPDLIFIPVSFFDKKLIQLVERVFV